MAWSCAGGRDPGPDAGDEPDSGADDPLYCGAAASAGQSWFDRQTALLDAEGVLILEYDPVLNYTTHPQLVLEDCQLIFGR